MIDKEQWVCYICANKYDKPSNNEEAYNEYGRVTGVYYCKECTEKYNMKDIK